jgi:hypothetical protein
MRVPQYPTRRLSLVVRLEACISYMFSRALVWMSTFWNFDLFPRCLKSMSHQEPFTLQVIQRDMVISTYYRDLLARASKHLNRFDAFLILCETGSWSVIGEHKSIHDEVTIIGIITKVSSVPIIFLTISGLCPQPLKLVSPTQNPIIPRNLT